MLKIFHNKNGSNTYNCDFLMYDLNPYYDKVIVAKKLGGYLTISNKRNMWYKIYASALF